MKHLSLLALLVGAAFGAGLPAHLLALTPESSTDVLIQFHESPGPVQRGLVRWHGGVIHRELPIVNGLACRIPRAAFSSIAAAYGVKQITLDTAVRGAIDEAGPTIGAPTAFSSGWTGKGIGVAVIDSGVWANHADLAGRIAYAEEFRSEKASNDDLSGHGTHVAMIIAGTGARSAGTTKNFRGVAPEARIVSLAALDRYNAGRESDVIAAIQRAIELKSTYNIRVMNLSLGRPVSRSYKKDPLCQAVEKAWTAGIVVVTSAGNDGRNNSKNTSGYGTITSPGNDPFVITVGATATKKTNSRSDDTVTSYSSKGPTLLDRIAKPDLVAPGNAIISGLAQGGRYRNEYMGNVVPDSYYIAGGNPNGDTYFTLSGTSMAAPMVSGAVALMLQKEPGLTPDQVKARLMRTASNTNFPTQATVTSPDGATYVVRHDLLTVGAGYLDINAALADTNKSNLPALSPAITYNSSTRKVSLSTGVYGVSVVWGSTSAFATNVIWGSTLVSGSNILWGDNVVWGDSTVSGFNLLWGDNILWGDNSNTAAESDGVIIKGDR